MLTTTTAARSIAEEIFRGLIIVNTEPATLHGDFALGRFLEGVEFLLILWGESISWERSTRTGETHRAPTGAGRTPAQALDIQSRACVAGTTLGGILPLVAFLSSYPARMAPEPIATGIHAGHLLRVGLWVCLRLQAEGGSASHVEGSRRCVRKKS